MTIVSECMSASVIEPMGIKHCFSLQAALDDAIAYYGPNCKVAVFPRATTVMRGLLRCSLG